MRAAVIENGVVTNLVETDTLDFPGLTLVEAREASIGDLWTGESFSPLAKVLAASPGGALVKPPFRLGRFWRFGGGQG